MPSTPNQDAGLPEDMTREEMEAFLSPDEIEALTSGDDPLTLAEAPADGDDDDLADAEGDDGDATDGEGDADGEGEGDDTVPPIDVDAPDPAPPVAPDVSGFDAKIAELDTRLDQLTDEYDQGDLTRDEWRAQQKAIVAEQARAQAERDSALSAVNEQTEAYRQGWFAKVAAYQAQHPYLADATHYDGWDAALKAASRAYPDLSMNARIEQAHRMLAAHIEGTTGKPLPTKPGIKRTAAKPGPRTDPRPEAPTTLSGYTQADVQAVDTGKFSALDRLTNTDPERAERIIAAMSDAEREAYLTT